MALKYWLEYNDVKNITHRLELYDDDFVGTSTEIFGNIIYDYASTDNVLECIRGCGLNVRLEASSSLTFEDLFTEEERQIKAIYERNSVTKFVGWLNPDGWYEDFTVDKWIVTFDVVDGLSYLSNLSYVDDTTGFPFVGKQSQLEVISNCLIRSGLNLNINTDINIVYTGLSTSLDVLDNVYVNTQRFTKDDGATIMDCEKVLRSILEPYAACITMHNGEWYIFKPNQLYSSSSITYYRYNYLGVALTPTTSILDTSFSLGSEIDGYYPHHANSNQSVSNNKSLGALRVNYKYGFVKSFWDNEMFCSNDGLTLDDWTIDPTNSAYLTLISGGCGAELDIVDSDLLILSNTSTTLDEGITLDFDIRWKPTGSVTLCNMQFKASITGGGTTYFLMSNGEWTTTDTVIVSEDVYDPTKEYSINFKAAALPTAGSVLIYIYLPKVPSTPPTPVGTINLIKFALSNEDQNAGIRVGENHTFQRTTNPSSNVDNVIEVTTGDSDIDAYMGTIYKNTLTATTTTWNRIGVTESIPIIRLMGEEHLRLKQNTARVFSGDVYGFFDYFSTVTINGFTGVFIVIKYSCNTKSNLISVEFKQIFGTELTDIDYEMTYDYGNVVKPTIRS